MLNWVIGWSLRHRFMVILGALAFVLWGLHSLSRLPIDAFPDTTPVQVQISTVAPALSPEEVERQITQPVEVAVSGLPRLTGVQSKGKGTHKRKVKTTQNDGPVVEVQRQVR